MIIICESCRAEVPVPKHHDRATCSCGASYLVNQRTCEIMRAEITTFFRPGECTTEYCQRELLQALADVRTAKRRVELWERKLREAIR